jgi:uncharacterized protein (DUF1697 family)
MPVLISLLRGVNVGGHHKVKMEELRALYASLGLEDVRTYINSGNLLFRTAERDMVRLRQRIEDAIEGACGFRPDVILRTPSDLKHSIARNPFAERSDVEPSKVAIHFLAAEPIAAALEQVRAMETAPEELHIHGRELYIYYALGMARPKLKVPQLEKALRTTGTSRNLNTVRKLIEMAV